jgi:hypothetical protein
MLLGYSWLGLYDHFARRFVVRIVLFFFNIELLGSGAAHPLCIPALPLITEPLVFLILLVGEGSRVVFDGFDQVFLVDWSQPVFGEEQQLLVGVVSQWCHCSFFDCYLDIIGRED